MLDPNIYYDKYIKILDENDNIVASGKVITFKPDFIDQDVIYISFDEKWFYSNIKCKFKEVDYVDTFVLDEPPSFLVWDYWRNNYRGITVDVYRDFNYDEIDPEIKPYVDRLNNISSFLKTCVSCCGHGIKPWYIGIAFTDLAILSQFLKILSKFQDTIILKSNCSMYINHNNCAMFMLIPNKEDNDFQILDSFITKLEKYFKYIT